MSRLRLVFDLDDTLYPERQWALGGFAAAGAWAERTLGVSGVANRLTALLDAGHLGEAFRLALAEAKPDHTPEDAKGLLRAFGAHTPALSLFDDALRVLEHFTDEPLGLITDGRAETQATKVAALGLNERFAHIVYTGALGPDRAFHKPHPLAFERMEVALERAPGDRFVYVGDNPAKDFVAPNALGWRTVLIDRPEHRATRIHKLVAPPPGGAPQVILSTLHDLPEVLG